MTKFLFSFFLVLLPAVASARTLAKSSTKSSVSLSTTLSQSHLQIATPTQLWTSVTLRAKKGISGERAPLNLGVVIDRSTSMRGDKFVQAKSAAKKMISLLEASDRIAIVSYGSDVSLEHKSVLATAANKETLENAVDRIELGGSTNLSGGYEMARQLVTRQSADHTINRILLLSDGNANVGLRSVSELGGIARFGLNNGVSLTTVGVGLDYNEDIMTEMAKEGAGNYYFVNDEKKLASFFHKEFRGLAQTLARKTNVVITTAPGVELLEVKGFKSSTKGQKTTIRLAEFHSEQRKDILVRIAVSPQKLGKTLVATVALGYDDVEREKRIYASRRLFVEATDNEVLANKRNRDVMKRVQQVETAETFVEAMNEQEKGNVEKAQKIITRQQVSNKAFQKQYQFDSDDSFARVDKELSEMKKDSKRPSSSAKAKRLRKAKKARAYDVAASSEAF